MKRKEGSYTGVPPVNMNTYMNIKAYTVAELQE
jgi:hypothetical protein